MAKDIEKIQESLSPHERKILPYLEDSFIDICKKSNLDKISVLRALEYLANKQIIELKTEKQKIIDLGVNGIHYKKNGLPERQLLNFLFQKRISPINDAQKLSKLNPNEFKAALGALKSKAMVEMKNGKIIFGIYNTKITN